jgi:hypothetical protein
MKPRILAWSERKEAWATAIILGLVAGLFAIVIFGCAAKTPPIVIVKHDLAPPQKPAIPRDPYALLPPDIAAAIRRGDNTTVFHHGTSWIYPYSPDRKYVVKCRPNFATRIVLRDDEDTDENNVILGDSTRWDFKIGMHAILLKPLGTNKPIAIPDTEQRTIQIDPRTNKPVKPPEQVRPPDPDMNTNLLITTNKRIYDVWARIGRPLTDTLSWYYRDDVRREAAEREQALKEAAQRTQ